MRSVVLILFLMGCMISAIPNAPEGDSNPQNYQLTCMDYGCWDGIIAGVTSVTEAQILLEFKYGDLTFDRQTNYLSWESQNNNGSMRIDESGTVYDLYIFLPQNQFTVSELINEIGEPSVVFVAISFSSGSLCAGAFLFYPDLGISAWLYPQGSSVGVSANQSIQGLDFISLAQAETFSITDHWEVEWQGYADYCALANP